MSKAYGPIEAFNEAYYLSGKGQNYPEILTNAVFSFFYRGWLSGRDSKLKIYEEALEKLVDYYDFARSPNVEDMVGIVRDALSEAKQ
jgi:hypothetical protein